MKGPVKYRPKYENRNNKEFLKKHAGKVGNKTGTDYQDTLVFDLVQHQFDQADPSCKSLICLRERRQWKKFNSDW